MVAHAVAASDEHVLIFRVSKCTVPAALFVRAAKQDNHVVNVRVGGNCVEVLRGEVTLAI